MSKTNNTHELDLENCSGQERLWLESLFAKADHSALSGLVDNDQKFDLSELGDEVDENLQ